MTLTINQLTKCYHKGVKALQDVSLSVSPGMFGLLGPNGAGKSTLMRILATLQEADSGSAFLGDLDVLKQKHEVRSCLGYLPQEFGLYPKVKAKDLLEHLAVLKGITDKKQRVDLVDALLEQTNLFAFADRKLGTFSGGMRQRFGIAAALIGNPKLIIVDEPTAGLDPEERVRFHNLLSELGGKDIVVVLSTHIVADVADICPQMAVLNQGRVVISGTTSDLIKDLDGQVWQRRVRVEDAKTPVEGAQIISTKRSDNHAVVRYWGPDVSNPELEATPPTLEDVYFAAVKGSGTFTHSLMPQSAAPQE